MASSDDSETRSASKAATPTGSEQPLHADETRSDQHFVVGLGASAGGLEVLRALFSGLNAAVKLSFVVVQHLSPQHRSRLAELIGHATTLTVREAAEGDRIEPGTIYIAPPNSDIVIRDTTLHLEEITAKVGPKPSIDRFFRSLADAQGEYAIGVILSGTGSDGAQGLQAIKAAGGVTLVQSPKTAKYDGMPTAAIQTGSVDLKLDPDAIASQLLRFDRLANRNVALAEAITSKVDPYSRILSLLQHHTQVNFSNYKHSTVRRRIQRRMAATHCDNLTEYESYLKENPSESKHLFQDILISVTSFFRDPQAFDEFEEQLTRRIRQKPDGGALRVWVVGCATGEEAYTVSILAHEIAAQLHKDLRIQLFATDIDEHALAVARKATYPLTAINDVPERYRSYFHSDGDMLHIPEHIRDSVVFARHNVCDDPAFLRLDIVTCRNVLIYFDSSLQERVLKTFHFALDKRGLLFLGKSEATASASLFFTQLLKTAKIYQRDEHVANVPKSRQKRDDGANGVETSSNPEPSASNPYNIVMAFAPDSVLVSEDGRVLQIFGEATQYLNFPPGAPTTTLSRLLPNAAATELLTLLHKASRFQATACGLQNHFFPDANAHGPIRLEVTQLLLNAERLYCVAFRSMKAEPSLQAAPEDLKNLDELSSNEQILRLKHELKETRDHLQSALEEHETANEELQALNEELQSSNEELQSTNEELETTNEELQSTNEELTTLNEELNVRTGELYTLNQRFQAVQNAISYPLLILDGRGRIVDYNPAARYLLRVTESDRGEYVRSLETPIDLRIVFDLIDDALNDKKDKKLQFETKERNFEARVEILDDPRGSASGAVVSFVENTEIVNLLNENRAVKERLEAILENTPAIVSMKDPTGAYTYVNKQYQSIFGLSADEARGKTDEDLFGSELGDLLRERDFEVFKSRRPQRYEETIPVNGVNRHWVSAKFPLLDHKRAAVALVTVALDITETVEHRRQLEIFRTVVSSATDGIAIFRGSEGAYALEQVSDRFRQNLGISDNEDAGLHSLFETLFPNQAQSLVTNVERHGDDAFTLPAFGRQSGKEWYEMKAACLNLEDKTEKFIVLSLYNVTERIQTQQMLQQQQDEVSEFSRLASLGEIAAGISHEINTPLNVIMGRTTLLRKLIHRDQVDVGRMEKTAADIDAMVENISQVVSGLKSVSGMDADQRTQHDLGSLIEEATRICDFRIRRAQVDLSIDLADTPALVECYPVQIVQILINLINNAVDAISPLRKRWVHIQSSVDDGKAVIRVTDSGKGIPQEVAERIMTPFYTTKKETSGTGLGLSISRNLARAHGGDLRIDMTSKNTSFLLDLPVYSQEEPA